MCNLDPNKYSNIVNNLSLIEKAIIKMELIPISNKLHPINKRWFNNLQYSGVIIMNIYQLI